MRRRDQALDGELLALGGAAAFPFFRRASRLLVVGMVAHGLWDVSLFLPGGGSGTAGAQVNLALLIIVPIFGICGGGVSAARPTHGCRWVGRLPPLRSGQLTFPAARPAE